MRATLEVEAVVGVDPGLATGMCRVFPAVGFELAWTLDHLAASDWIVQAAQHYGPRIVFAYEVFRPRKGAYDWKPESVEVAGVIKWACWKWGCQIADQEVADAKMFASNQKLRELGWWERGQSDHARDAARHVLLFLARANMYDGRRVLWGGRT